MWNESLLRLIIEIFQRLAAGVLVLCQIVIRSIGDAFEFLSAKRKVVFDVVSAFRIKRALFVRHCFARATVCARDADVLVELQPLFLPVLEQLHPLLRPAEIFQLHLLELARSKCEIAWIDFIPKSLPDLRDAKWQLLARHFENIFELNKD